MTIVAAVVAAVSMNGQLLYKISGNGLEKPSYIIGTHHLANVGFVEKINGVKEALTETDQVFGELKWDSMTNPDSLKMMQQVMLLPEGKTLKDILTTDQYKRLDAFMTQKLGAGMSNPTVAAQMGKLSPMALVTQFQVLLYMMNHMGEFDPSSTFDQYFQAQAQKNNLPCGGLETMAFQANLLYNQPMERQVEQLMCLIDNEQFNTQMMEDMAKAFYAQDLDALQKAMDEKLGTSCDSTPEEEALPGEKGVLQLLRNAGYTVEGQK